MRALVLRNRVALGIFYAIVGAACWGFSGTCAQYLMQELSVSVNWITPVRMIGAAVFFLALAYIKQPEDCRACLKSKSSLATILCFGVFGILMTQICYLSCIGTTNSGTGTVLERTGLIVILAYSCFSKRRLPRSRELLGIILALSGVSLIAFQGDITNLSIPAEGLIFGLLSGVSMAAYTLIPVRPLKLWGSYIVIGLGMLFGGILALLGMQPWNIVPAVSWELVIAMIAMVLIGTFGAYNFYLKGVVNAGAVRASLIGCVEPISATLFSIFWLQTSFSNYDLAGFACIIIMMFLVIQMPSSKKTEEINTLKHSS